jgi:hypothetical protein
MEIRLLTEHDVMVESRAREDRPHRSDEAQAHGFHAPEGRTVLGARGTV